MFCGGTKEARFDSHQRFCCEAIDRPPHKFLNSSPTPNLTKLALFIYPALRIQYPPLQKPGLPTPNNLSWASSLSIVSHSRGDFQIGATNGEVGSRTAFSDREVIDQANR